jgi:O-6-methylguanine DNA methyltransferase
VKRATAVLGKNHIRIALRDGVLRAVRLPQTVPATLNAGELHRICNELSAHKVNFDHAPDFARRVWTRVQRIPRGQVMTYGEIARDLGQPAAARAVGMACAKNPLLLAVPCHRVVAVNGLGGYRMGLAWKCRLLELERENLG